jgi:Protein of unknown function (DUF2934)
MARAKSTSGKGRTSKTQADVTSPASTPDVNAAKTAELASQELRPESPITSTAKPKNGSDAVPEAKSEMNKSESKMFEVRKTDSRKNVVPINLEDEIRRRAYELYKQREPGAGSEADDWFTAEREVMQRYHQQSA